MELSLCLSAEFILSMTSFPSLMGSSVWRSCGVVLSLSAAAGLSGVRVVPCAVT